ncbi:MAG: SPOR domain-containing protein [Bacteroidetes bacterium]|nr:SPOR domain-containing protein [Bacteroidota bacterium]
MNVEQCIPDLLYEYDCVIIPGFGGFIGNYTPANIHPVHHTFLPPSKSLLFNVTLKQNDGLLASRMVSRENISFDEANRQIRVYVENCNAMFKKANGLDIPGVGKLFKDKEGNIQFEQDRTINYLADAFGLSSFVSLPVQRKKIHKRIEKKFTKYIESQGSGKRILSRTYKWAAMLAIPIGAAAILGITNFDKIQRIPFNYSGFLNSGSSSEVSSPVPEKRNRITYGSIRGPQWNSRGLLQSGISPLVNPIHDESGGFAIIVGAFKIKGNAERLIDQLIQDGNMASLAGQTKSGLYRVSIKEYQDREQAMVGMNNTRSKGFPGAWLLEK